MTVVQNVPIADIEASDVALRGVQIETEEWQGLKDSIAQYGVMNSIQVRKDKVVENVQKYVLIDGLQRFTACKTLGLETIPATVIEGATEIESLMRQMIGNVSRIETKPAAQSKHILRMLMLDPLLTRSDIATSLCQSVAWVNQRLSLTRLIAEVQALVDNGSIPLYSAYAMSRLTDEEQKTFLDDALSLDAQQFAAKIKEHSVKQKRNTQRGEDGVAEWAPTQHLRKPGDVKTQFAALISGESNTLVSDAQQAGVEIDPETAKFVLAWVLSVDPLSAAEQKKKHEAREQKKKELNEQKKKEREEQKKKDSATVDLLKL